MSNTKIHCVVLLRSDGQLDSVFQQLIGDEYKVDPPGPVWCCEAIQVFLDPSHKNHYQEIYLTVGESGDIGFFLIYFDETQHIHRSQVKRCPFCGEEIECVLWRTLQESYPRAGRQMSAYDMLDVDSGEILGTRETSRPWVSAQEQ